VYCKKYWKQLALPEYKWKALPMVHGFGEASAGHNSGIGQAVLNKFDIRQPVCYADID
jgi:hypothetical protein